MKNKFFTKFFYLPDQEIVNMGNKLCSLGLVFFLIGVGASPIVGFRFFLGLTLGLITSFLFAGAISTVILFEGKHFKSSTKDKYVYREKKGKGKFRGY